MYEEKEIKYKKRKKEPAQKQQKEKKNSPELIEKINWKQLIIKLLILVLVMVLIIFIISRVSKNNKEKDFVINNNLNTIINGTIDYYSKQNLPNNIGDSTSLLLDEMIKKELINPLIDKQEKECDSKNSYIIITKIAEKEYRLKVYLTCPKESKAIEKIISCEEECKIKNS